MTTVPAAVPPPRQGLATAPQSAPAGREQPAAPVLQVLESVV